MPARVSALALSVLVAALAGSPHCAGMCGAFAWMAGGPEEAKGPRGRGAEGMMAYHAARLAAYALLGAAAGLLGHGVNSLGSVSVAVRGAGIVMVASGTAGLLAAAGVPLPRVMLPTGRVMIALASRLRTLPRARAVALGAASALLPCGLLYTFVAVAAGTGSPITGSLIMLAFWAGTVPAFVVLAGAARRLVPASAMRVVTSIVLLVAGVLTIAGRMPGASLHAHGLS